MPYYLRSKTAGTNATADPTINWAEGQSPSSINDSARAMMARLKEWGDDDAGILLGTGTSTAYAVTTNEVFDSFAHMSGAVITFAPPATNDSGVTLNVDSLGAKAIHAPLGTPLGAGIMLTGTFYRVSYFLGSDVFLLHQFSGQPFTIPIGGMVDYFGTTVPNSNFAFPSGQAISRSTYSTLFSLIGTTFGPGDGSTTFNIPDLRGRVTAGKDNMGGSSANRIGSVATDSGTIVGATLGSVGGSSTHILTTAEMPAHAHGTTESAHVHGVHGNNGALGQSGANFAAITSGNPLISTGVNNLGTTDPVTTGLTVNNAGGSNAHALLQPTMIVNKIMRII